jgi:hypothetical protein
MIESGCADYNHALMHSHQCQTLRLGQDTCIGQDACIVQNTLKELQHESQVVRRKWMPFNFGIRLASRTEVLIPTVEATGSARPSRVKGLGPKSSGGCAS